eukprot:CAMPEP_0197043586 /NCGR_PEP_ID=MMETSP1384-20130603/19812_1 /TAXON_ID=29189 /ORGANISM="Ammonia sp." /LENGTH=265 /DNA_ID=CAMNT_0042474907 /DNA_START=346 /DNA_END=1143 /DNA_ORIENTATION=+
MYLLATLSDAITAPLQIQTSAKSALLSIALLLAICGVIVYVATASFAMFIFTRNLITLTNTRADSVLQLAATTQFFNQSSDDNDDDWMLPSEQDIEYEARKLKLNEDQLRLIDSISRYVSLFMIAILTSVLNVSLVITAERLNWHRGHSEVLNALPCLDCCINIVCLYLQYQFNVHYFQRYCKCVGACWKRYFTNKAKKNMRRTYRLSVSEENQRIAKARMSLRSDTAGFSPVKTTPVAGTDTDLELDGEDSSGVEQEEDATFSL